MTSNEEDTMNYIYNEVRALKITKLFEEQLSKMNDQEKHQWKTIMERWEYAFNKVKNLN